MITTFCIPNRKQRERKRPHDKRHRQTKNSRKNSLHLTQKLLPEMYRLCGKIKKSQSHIDNNKFRNNFFGIQSKENVHMYLLNLPTMSNVI